MRWPNALKPRGWRYSLASRFGDSGKISDAPPATFVLLSYARPRNIAAIVRGALRCSFVEKVIISNNNPKVDLRSYLPASMTGSDERVELVQQNEPTPARFRMELARDSGADHVLAIDDDLFLRPSQLARMYAAYLARPEVPHGVGGGTQSEHGARGISGGYTGPVDILNRGYAISRRHIERYFELLPQVNAAGFDLQWGFDIVLSFSGEGRPWVTDMGRLLDCPTARRAGVALCAEDGFRELRTRLYRTMKQLTVSAQV